MLASKALSGRGDMLVLVNVVFQYLSDLWYTWHIANAVSRAHFGGGTHGEICLNGWGQGPVVN